MDDNKLNDLTKHFKDAPLSEITKELKEYGVKFIENEDSEFIYILPNNNETPPVKIVFDNNPCPIMWEYRCKHSKSFNDGMEFGFKCGCKDKNKDTCRFYNYGIYKID